MLEPPENSRKVGGIVAGQNLDNGGYRIALTGLTPAVNAGVGRKNAQESGQSPKTIPVAELV